jgi:hypothetical protein
MYLDMAASRIIDNTIVQQHLSLRKHAQLTAGMST